jgi:hypothetical protein
LKEHPTWTEAKDKAEEKLRKAKVKEARLLSEGIEFGAALNI